MPRLPAVTDRAALPADKQHIYDYLAETRGSVRLPFAVLLNSPEVAYRFAQVGTYMRFESSLPRDISELAICTAAREMDCGYEWAAHSRAARELGIGDAVIDAIASRRDVDALPAAQSLPIRYARQLLREHRVDDSLFQEALTAYGEKGVLDLTGTIAYYAGLACLINAMDIQPAADAPQLP